jgi:small subunit ribosomal protein S20
LARYGSAGTVVGRASTAAPLHITEEFQRPVVANIKSQLKRIKTNEKSRQRNKATKSSLKTSIRRFREAADAGEVAKATELAYAASRALDQAASKGIIHKNQAANRKSAIAAKAARLESSAKKPRKRARSASASAG